MSVSVWYVTDNSVALRVREASAGDILYVSQQEAAELVKQLSVLLGKGDDALVKQAETEAALDHLGKRYDETVSEREALRDRVMKMQQLLDKTTERAKQLDQLCNEYIRLNNVKAERIDKMTEECKIAKAEHDGWQLRALKAEYERGCLNAQLDGVEELLDNQAEQCNRLRQVGLTEPPTYTDLAAQNGRYRRTLTAIREMAKE